MALDPRAAAQFDEMFMTMASQHKDIAGLFKTFFGFLHRKTDVYVVNRDNGNMGFPEGVAEKLVRGQQPRAARGNRSHHPCLPGLRHRRPSPSERPRAARK